MYFAHLFYNVCEMTTRHRPLGEFELAVLLSVARLGDDAYSLRIARDVSAARGHDYSVGAVHTALQRLEEKHLVESWMSDPLPVRGGRSRRHYELTVTGRRTLREAEARTARVWAGVDLRGKPA